MKVIDELYAGLECGKLVRRKNDEGDEIVGGKQNQARKDNVDIHCEGNIKMKIETIHLYGAKMERIYSNFSFLCLQVMVLAKGFCSTT